MNNNPRFQVWKILIKVFKNQSFSNILLNESSKQKWSLKDKNLIFNLVHGTITQKIYLNYLTRKLIHNKTPLEVQVILWMSLYQLAFLEKIPNYAIVNEAVEIAKIVNSKFSGLVNACLKKAITDKNFWDVNVKNPEIEFCLKNAFPFELYLKIKKDYGINIVKKIVQDSIQKPTISFRVNSLKISYDDFYNNYSEKLTLEKSKITKSGLITSEPIFNTKLYTDGLVMVQDQASILVSEVLNPQLNDRVLDMCSAPGGKLTHLAALMQNHGEIIAYEISKNKISLITQNLVRLGVKNVTLVNKDALTINDDKKFDVILLDAPCSGFGVLKRKPEIKLNFNQEKIIEIIKLQTKLLDIAYKNLKSNGFLVFSTCTINKDENQNQIKKFINKYSDMKVIFEKQLFGFENNTDGFYICKLQKLG